MADPFSIGSGKSARLEVLEVPLVVVSPTVSTLTLPLSVWANKFILSGSAVDSGSFSQNAADFILNTGCVASGCSLLQYEAQYGAISQSNGLAPLFTIFDLSVFLPTSDAVYSFDTSTPFVPVKIVLYYYTYL